MIISAPLAACALALAAGCGGSGDASGTATGSGATVRAAASVPPEAPAVPLAAPWKCTEHVWLDDMLMRLEYVNQSSKSFVLRAAQPRDCAPWGSNDNPGQVNATDAVVPGDTLVVGLAYDGFTDERNVTRSTPVPITIKVLGDNAADSANTTPAINLVRTVGGDGRYTRRNFFLRSGGRDACTGTVRIPALSPPGLVGTFDCRGEGQYGDEPPARLVITDATG